MYLFCGDRQLPCTSGDNVRQLLTDADWPVHSLCRGNGDCGLCQIRIQEGRASDPTDQERRRLAQIDIDAGFRLACQTIPLTDLRISLEHAPFPANWVPEDEDSPCVNHTAGDLDSPFAFVLAVDLGSSRIRISLCETHTGNRRADRTTRNPQSAFGDDVLTRLSAASRFPEAAAELSSLVIHALDDGLGNLERTESLSRQDVGGILIVGNTAMLSLLSQKNPGALLDPENWQGQLDCTPSDPKATGLTLGLHPEAFVRIVPPLAGFIGSDLLAGVVATGLNEGPPGSMLIDIGTNTEIALWDGENLHIASTPGGPAFEGTGILCGMPAEQGAVYRVRLESGNRFHTDVIGGGVPRGLCGSGLIDLLACLISTGHLSRGGRLRSIPDQLQEEGWGTIKKGDVDILQRAKAAIAAGTRCLLSSINMKPADLKRISVCGAFGTYLNVESAQAIGLLPGIPSDLIEICGNTALAGCRSLLFNSSAEDIFKGIRNQVRPLNLTLASGFEDTFIESLFLEPFGAD